MKKTIVSILLIIIMFNLIYPIISYADDDSASEEYNNLINGDTREIISGGVTKVEKIVPAPTLGGVVASVLTDIANVISFTIYSAISSLVKSSPTEEYSFSVYDAVFNNIDVFDANYLTDSNNTNNIHLKIKEQVEIWYNATRKIAIALSLCVLIYVGIRMAISTLADDRAKYKKMLIGWLQGFILIFFMHYIILLSTIVAKVLLDLLRHMPVSEEAEVNIFWQTFNRMFSFTGWDEASVSIVYWVLVFYQVKFFFLYAKRMLSIAFLIIISPLVTITYPIDKIGDGKAQAFQTWFQEFEVNMFIQPLHALLYGLFFMSASEIILRAPLLVAIFLMGLSRGEKIIKGIFNARGMKSISSMGKGKKKKRK